MRICFDVDGVIAKEKDSLGNTLPYKFREPCSNAVEYINSLKSSGHTIIIQTARYMKWNKGHQLMAIEQGYTELKKWLDEHGILYDEIYLGKPSADIYVDDRGFQLKIEQGKNGWEDLMKEVDKCQLTP